MRLIKKWQRFLCHFFVHKNKKSVANETEIVNNRKELEKNRMVTKF